MVLVVTGVLPATGKTPVADQWSRSLPGPPKMSLVTDAELTSKLWPMAKWSAVGALLMRGYDTKCTSLRKSAVELGITT